VPGSSSRQSPVPGTIPAVDSAAPAFSPLARFGDEASARLAAALLESAGIITRVHGESLGPYRLTVGNMAVTEIWVHPDEIDDAAELLTAAEIEHVLNPEVRGGAVADPGNLPMRLLALVTLAIVAAAVIRALMRVF